MPVFVPHSTKPGKSKVPIGKPPPGHEANNVYWEKHSKTVPKEKLKGLFKKESLFNNSNKKVLQKAQRTFKRADQLPN